MPRLARRIVLISCGVAFAAFCAVQDRIVREGASQYVAARRAAIAMRQPPVPVDRVMGPAIERSVRLGVLAGAAVLVVGIGVAAAVARRR